MVEGCGVVVFVDQFFQRRPRGRGQGDEGEVSGRAGFDPDPGAQAEDGIEHGAHRVAERTAVHDRDGRPRRLTPADEAGAVGFVLQPAAGLGSRQEMRRPGGRFGGRARTPPGQQPARLGQILGLHEQVGKGGVGKVRPWWR